jgi:CHAD domain-containing protein
MISNQPVTPSSKLKIELAGDMPCHYALSSVLLQNLEMLENCEAGIIADIDNEFLHTFRIAGRRSRSLLNQIKQVYPVSRITRFNNAFSWLSECTSVNRDLDVFLADFPSYKERIGTDGAGALEPLREQLLSQRYQEHSLLLNLLASRRYASFKSNWRDYLLHTVKQAPRTANSSLPIIEVANKYIWHNYRKLIKQGKNITSKYDYENLHTLRKNAKKLRYLLETFKSIYSAKEVSLAIKVLKKLQDNLGAIVDMHIQKRLLGEWKQELQSNKYFPAQTLLAINNLGMLCNEDERTAKRKFKKRFNQFSTKVHQKLFHKTFN